VSEPEYDDPDGASIIDPQGKGPAIGWLRVPEGKSGKNRVHVDIRVAGEDPWGMTVRERLTQPSARTRCPRRHDCPQEPYEETLGHIVMLDPEGNEFCVA
jgi:hypothetical protein